MEGYDPSTDPMRELKPQERRLAVALLVLIALVVAGFVIWKVVA